MKQNNIHKWDMPYAIRINIAGGCRMHASLVGLPH